MSQIQTPIPYFRGDIDFFALNKYMSIEVNLSQQSSSYNIDFEHVSLLVQLVFLQ